MDRHIVSLGVDLYSGPESVGSGSKEQDGATGKKTFGLVSKAGLKRAAVVSKPIRSERVVHVRKSVMGKGPKLLG